jgi:hypothetical protein
MRHPRTPKWCCQRAQLVQHLGGNDACVIIDRPGHDRNALQQLRLLDLGVNRTEGTESADP